jgi:hypothetical protein
VAVEAKPAPAAEAVAEAAESAPVAEAAPAAEAMSETAEPPTISKEAEAAGTIEDSQTAAAATEAPAEG